VFECKNWKLNYKHRYSLKDAKEQILTRFHNCGINIKVLIISFKEQLSKRALSFLESNNILILETGKLIGKRDFRSKLVYSFGKQIKQLISNFKAKVKPTKPLFSYLVNSNKLTNCSSSNSNNTINKNDSDLENRELSIMNVKHPEHETWLNSEIERLEKADNFREIDF
jgi:hypothetical protein